MHRILIVYLSAGNGHRSAGKALKEVYENTHPNAEVMLLDQVELLGMLFGKLITDGYDYCSNNFPKIWELAYKIADIKRPKRVTDTIRRKLNTAGKRNLKKLIETYKPDQIICTHFTSGNILGELKNKGKIDIPIHVTITDIGLHQIWIAPGIDNYFVFHESTKQQLINSGVKASRIHVTGIPIKPIFTDRSTNQSPSSDKLNILLYNTYEHTRSLRKLALQCKKLPKEKFNLTIVGLKEHLIEEVQEFLNQEDIQATVHGFYNPLVDILEKQDILIGKSGGALTAECLSIGLPMLVYEPIPGQEEGNAEFLHEHQCGLYVKHIEDISYHLNRLIRQPKSIKLLKEFAHLNGKPDAARQIVQIITNYSSSKAASAESIVASGASS